MSDLRVSMDIAREPLANVPTLFQLALSTISSTEWSFSCDDIPEVAVPGLLQKIKKTDFDLDLLPNLLPASLQQLDLTGYSNLTEDTLLGIVKKCFSITELSLKDVAIITESVVPQILWNLPDLRYLSLGAGVGSISMLEIVQRPIKLVYLEINSASMDEMWLEQLRYFPDLISLKLRNVTIPRDQAVKLPPNLAIVDITTSFQKVSPESLNLFKFFMTNAPNLREFTYGGDHCFSVEEIGPIVARELKVLRAKYRIKVSKEVVDILNDTCQSLEEVSGLLLIKSKTGVATIGGVEFPAGSEKITYEFTTKKLNTDYKAITSQGEAWNAGPTKYYVPSFLGPFVLPIDPCTTLKSLFVYGPNIVEIAEILQLLPNLEVLTLFVGIIKLTKLPADVNCILAPKLKTLDLRCKQVAAGVIDLFTKSTALKRVSIGVDIFPEFEGKSIQFDELLMKFPNVEKLKVLASDGTLTNRIKEDTTQIHAVQDHPLKELQLFKNGELNDDNNTQIFTVKAIDFNRYKCLQLLHFEGTYMGPDVILHTKLKALIVKDIKGLYKTTFILPDTLQALKWESTFLEEEIVAAIPNMKKLNAVFFNSPLKERITKTYGDSYSNTVILKNVLKYLVPRRREVTKTNLLSAFSGIKPTSSPMEKLRALLESSGSNLSIPELQLIAEMYSRQEISLQSDQPVVHVKIRLTSGAVMNINCNPIHRVIDLYAYARHAVKLGDKAFDLVIPPKQVLDLSTYNKTVQELRLANTTLIQKLREATPVENELRSFGLYHSRLINFNKTSSSGIPNQEDKSLKKSDAVAVNNTNNMASRVDEPSDDMLEEYDSNESELDEPEQLSDEDDTMLLSDADDDDTFDMYFSTEKEKKEEQITAENKHLLDQMNAEAMRISREYHAKLEREEQEEARRKHEAENRAQEQRDVMRQLRVNQAPRLYGYQQPQPVQQANPLRNVEFMTDEEMARMLQEEEYFQDNF